VDDEDEEAEVCAGEEDEAGVAELADVLGVHVGERPNEKEPVPPVRREGSLTRRVRVSWSQIGHGCGGTDQHPNVRGERLPSQLCRSQPCVT
jgi:hypothetical protein